MVLPFGVSAGDFIAVIGLVHDVAQSLKASGGSRQRFLQLVAELEHLEESLLSVARLVAPPGFERQLEVLRTAAARCENVILGFLSKNDKFVRVFDDDATEKWWKAPLRKVEWAVYRKGDVEDLRAALQAHTAMVGLLLHTFHINCTYSASKSWDESATAIVRRLDRVEGQQNAMTNLLQTVLAAASTMRSEGTQDIAKVLELLNVVIELQKMTASVPAQVLREQPVYFTDACGRLSTFDLSFITSKEAFLYVLKERFDVGGARRIDRGMYVLEDAKKRRDIDQAKDWRVWFWPGQEVNMSMLFDEGTGGRTSTCPRCGFEDDAAPDEDVKW